MFNSGPYAKMIMITADEKTKNNLLKKRIIFKYKKHY